MSAEYLDMPDATRATDTAPAVRASKRHGDLCARVLTIGSDLLADQDILEFVLSTVSRRNAKRLAETLLSQYGSFARVIAAPVWSLLKTQGLGPAEAALLKCMEAAALRKVRADVTAKPILGGWDRLVPYLHAVLSREKVEQFLVLFLDNRNRLIAEEAQQRGTVNHTPVYPREVAKRALELQATALILAHNHPSGDPTPSRDDVVMTEQIRAAVAPLSIAVHDHIVIGNGRWFSFRKTGLLDESAASRGGARAERTLATLGRISEHRSDRVGVADDRPATSPRQRRSKRNKTQ